MIKPFFSNKGNYRSKIKLVEKDEVLQDDDLIAMELNKLFNHVLGGLFFGKNSAFFAKNGIFTHSNGATTMLEIY